MYQLKPMRKGDLTIGPFKGRGTARGLTSNKLIVKVSERGPATSAQQEKQNRLYAQVKWESNQNEVWLGEPIEAMLTVYVLNRLNLVDLEAPSINLQGFWARELETPRRSGRVEMGGRIYHQRIIKRDQLTPLKAGLLTLPELDLALTVSTQRLFSQSQRLDVHVNPVKIKVKPLPPNPPKGFKGPTVGEVKLVAMLDRSRIRQDDSVQLTLKTSTTGMLANTPALDLPYIDGVRIFPPTTRKVSQSIGGKEVMVRMQTWLLKPERAGQFKIPSIKLPYFDPQRGQYSIARSRALRLRVKSNPNSNRLKRSAGSTKTAAVSAPSRKEQQRLNQSRTSQQTATERLGVQLNSVLTEPISNQGYTLPMWLWWLLGILGPLTLVYTEFKRFLTRFTARSASGRAQVKAGRVALSRLSGLDGASLDYAVLDDVMISYLETRLQLTLRGRTREQVTAQLNQAGLSQELVEGYVGLCEVADFARFAASGDTTQSAEALELAETWIKLAERDLNDREDHKDKPNTAHLIVLISLLTSAICVQVNTSYADDVKSSSTAQNKAQNHGQNTWSSEGNKAFWSGDYDRAVKSYERELKLNPQDAGLWYNLGTTHAHGGRWGDAAYALERGLLIAPQSALILKQRAKIHQAVVEEGVRKPGGRRLILPDEVSSGGGVLVFFTVDALRALTLGVFSIACLLLVMLRRRAEKRAMVEYMSADQQLRSIKRDATLRASCLLMFILAMFSGGGWWAKAQTLSIRQGIVIANRVALHRGPGDQYKAEVNIAGSVKLELQGKDEKWRRVKLSDGRAGWLHDDEVRALTQR
jgi:tetratricopeptide (TPR) repeat protein